MPKNCKVDSYQRIDLIHKNCTDYIINDSKRYESEIAKGIAKVKEWRYYFLAAIGFCHYSAVAKYFSMGPGAVKIFNIIIAVQSMP